MKTANNLKSRQQGFSALLLVVLIPLAIIVVVFLFIFVRALFFGNGSTSTKELTQTQSQNKQNTQLTQSPSPTGSNSLFSKVETTNYVFYYPTDYQKAEGEGERLFNYYPSMTKKPKFEGVSLFIHKSSSLKPVATASMCQRIYEENVSGEGISYKLIKADAVDNANNTGCEIVYSLETGNTKAFSHTKYLWYKDGSDYNTYYSQAFYFTSVGDQEAEKMNLAVNQFTLK